MPIQDYHHLILWKELGFDKLPVISFETWIDSYQRKAEKSFWENSVFHIGLDGEGRSSLVDFVKDLRGDVAKKCYGYIQDKADNVQWEMGQQLMEAQKAVRLKGKKVTKNLNITPVAGGGVQFSNNELWALKECYQELQACIKEVRQANDIPLKKTPDFDWEKAKDLDLAAYDSLSWLGNLFHQAELPFFVSDPRVTECALEILCKRLKRSMLRYNITKRRLKDLIKIQINKA